MKKILSRRSSRLASLSLAVVLLGSVLSACAPLVIGGAMTTAMVASDRRTSGAQLEDQGIELRAASRLRDAMGDRGNASVTSYNRQVLITGEVGTAQDKALVEQTIAGVENVRSIVNELGVMGATSLTQRSADALVTGRIKATMIDARNVPANAFKVVTTRGTVYLMGRVTQNEADRATIIARNTQGVQRVVRLLEIITPEELARLQPQPAPVGNLTSSAPVR
ncbi:MAG: osmotically-inducible protein OsmY [Hydrogenophaga sp.]|jgi:osmotically-inducible protein OsmY